MPQTQTPPRSSRSVSLGGLDGSQSPLYSALRHGVFDNFAALDTMRGGTEQPAKDEGDNSRIVPIATSYGAPLSPLLISTPATGSLPSPIHKMLPIDVVVSTQDETFAEEEKFHIVWAYNQQGELKSVCRPSENGVTKTVLIRRIKKMDGDNTELLQAITSPPDNLSLSDSQVLFKIKTAYHHEFKTRMGEVILPQLDTRSPMVMTDGTLFMSYRLMSWQLKPRANSAVATPEDSTVAVYQGPPRVLELGCSDGNWCYKLKAEHPLWTVEGIDDTDHWTKVYAGRSPRDFLKESGTKSPGDYFKHLPTRQSSPEFTVRNLNKLIAHENPIPQNLYDMVRGRDIFDRVENYKMFLDDIRSILQPDGVVEFLEIDPRPRFGASEDPPTEPRTSRPAEDWTDSIADRFLPPPDSGLAVTSAPGWYARVIKRMESRIRPFEDLAGPNLKSWIEDAGFWDVKQHVWCIPVGGDSRSGQLLLKLLLAQISIEDEVPQLSESLPKVELEAMKSGKYHINLHIVTGRKPYTPRAGDLLLDGSRQEMTEQKYETMQRRTQSVANQWTRMENGASLEKLMDGLNALPGSPAYDIPAVPQTLTLPKSTL